MRKISFEEFVSRAQKVHGDKYEYSRQNFVDMRTKMIVHCKKHGDFGVVPHDLLCGHGCRKCDIDKKRHLLYGVALNDVYGSSKKSLAYKRWYNIIIRCYDTKIHTKHPTYKDCYMCDEWLIFSNFKKWFDANYIKGYHIDKDILIKGNKVYSPETCCFIPHRINTLLIKRDNDRGSEKIGVIKTKSGKYEASVSKGNGQVFLGTFSTEIEAFNAYKKEKEAFVKSVALKHFQEGKITESVYNALMNYQVELND